MSSLHVLIVADVNKCDEESKPIPYRLEALTERIPPRWETQQPTERSSSNHPKISPTSSPTSEKPQPIASTPLSHRSAGQMATARMNYASRLRKWSKRYIPPFLPFPCRPTKLTMRFRKTVHNKNIHLRRPKPLHKRQRIHRPPPLPLRHNLIPRTRRAIRAL